MKRVLLISVVLLASVSFGLFAQAVISDAVLKEVAAQFPNSTLSAADKLKELRWFSDAAKPFRGMSLRQ